MANGAGGTGARAVWIREAKEWCQEQKTHADEMVKRLGSGVAPDGTENLKDLYAEIAERMERLIKAYEKLNA